MRLFKMRLFKMRLFDQIHICLITMSMMSLLQQVYSYLFTAVLVPKDTIFSPSGVSIIITHIIITHSLYV